MKIFFSYGHDKNEPIVLRLKNDLESRGHFVWIDKSRIKGGDDWRRAITAGILDSELMMAFASTYSVRKPGVCLDELMIAVSVKGAQVQTVLLESEVVAPSNIGYRQYIDMSKWEQMQESPDFDQWYDQKLKEIVRVVESPETAKYAKEIEYLKDQLNPRLTSVKKERLQQEYFCGREWLTEKVRDWVFDEEKRVLLIDGAPGIGKSSYMAHEFLFNSAVGGVIFCEWDQPDFNNLDSISRSLVFQMAAKLPDYRQLVIHYLRNEQLRSGSEIFLPRSGESIFQDLFVRQLRSLIDGERPVTLILIDGIDEATGDRNDAGRKKNVFAEILQREIDSIPEWIRFVITSRTDQSVLQPLADASRLHIDEQSDQNRRDLREYVAHELSESVSPDYIDRVNRLCAGNFLFAKMICRAVRDQGVNPDEILKGKAGDLGFIYRSYFDRSFPDYSEYEEIYYYPLAALAVTEEPVPETTFMRMNHWSARRWNHVLKILGPYLSSSQGSVSIYHKSMRDWLMSPDADDYMIDREDGLRFIAEGCFEAYMKDIYAMNMYELKYLIPCLRMVGDDRLALVERDGKFADLLYANAEREGKKFQYETAVRLGKSALDIYIIIENYPKALQTYLYLAETTDLMVHLDDSINYCKQALLYADKISEPYAREMAGDFYMRLAYVYFKKADWEQSEYAYNKAIGIYKAIHDFKKKGLKNKYFSALMMKGNMLRHSNRPDEALACYREIEEDDEFASCRKEDPALYSCVLMNFGWALHNAGQYRDAEMKLTDAEKLIEEDRSRIPLKDIAQLYYLRGVELFDAAEYEKAKEYCIKALRDVKIVYGENAVEICSALNQLGAIAQKQSDHESAIRLFKRSYEVRKNYYGEHNLFTSISLRNYAKALIRRGRKEDRAEAGAAFRKVRDIREELCSTDKGKGWLAQICLDLSDYSVVTGDYQQAEMYVFRAEELYKICGIERDFATCCKQRGVIFLSAGRRDEAMVEFTKAVAILEKYYKPGHPYIAEVRKYMEDSGS